MESIDKTLCLNAGELWAHPLACPDWPLRREGQDSWRAYTRQDALNHLAALALRLNGEEGNLRRPTKAEADQFLAEHFTDGPPDRRGWYELGFMRRSRRLADPTPEFIVNAAHIRGWLRKLDAQAPKAAAR